MNKPRMKGKPQTWGPDEKGQMLAGATCATCYAQVLGDWAKDGKKGSGQNEHRQVAIFDVAIKFEKHVCSPEQLKRVEEERTKALAEDTNLRAEDWEPKPPDIKWVPLEVAKKVIH